MAPRFFSARGLVLAVLLLLACISTSFHHIYASPAAINDASGFAITASAVEKVASDKQLDSNQLFAKTWQVKGNTAANVSFVDYIRVRVPGRVFITYAESSASSSGAVGEVKVSGSSEAIVNIVDVVSNNTAGGPKLVLQTSATSIEGTYLLIEVQLFVKNQLKLVAVKSSADVVILDNVLYTKSGMNVKKTVLQRRRLSDAKAGLVVAATPKTTDYKGRAQQMYYIKPASGVLTDIRMLDLSLEVNGSMTLVQMNPDDGDGTYAGSITVTDASSKPPSSTMDQIQLVASRSSNGSEVLKLQATSTNASANNKYSVYVEMLSSVQVKLTGIDGMNTYDFFNVSYNDRVAINANGTGDVFILDQSLLIDVDTVSIFSTGSGNVQVDIADVSSDGGFTLYAYGSGNVTYFGPQLGSIATAIVGASATGRVCFDTKDEPYMSVPKDDKINQVSYTGKKDHAFECIKKDLPKRAPAKIAASEPATAESGSSSPASKTLSGSHVLHSASVATLVPIVVALLTAIDL